MLQHLSTNHTPSSQVHCISNFNLYSIHFNKQVDGILCVPLKQSVLLELSVPVPWGEIRGKIWGPDHGHPVLCVHGWADNCGTFNTLIPLLPKGNCCTLYKSFNYTVL